MRNKTWISDVQFLAPGPMDAYVAPGCLAVNINQDENGRPDIVVKRDVSGQLRILHRLSGRLSPGGFKFELKEWLDALREIYYEDLPGIAKKIKIPLGRTPFYFEKFGKVDVVFDARDDSTAIEFDNFITLNVDLGDTKFRYALNAVHAIEQVRMLMEAPDQVMEAVSIVTAKEFDKFQASRRSQKVR